MSSVIAASTTTERQRVWTREMKATLRANYPDARARDALRELAEALGVGLYQLYGQAHRMGLSTEIRKR